MAEFSYVSRHSRNATAGLRRVQFLISFVIEVVDALMTGQRHLGGLDYPATRGLGKIQLVVPLCWA